jgi:hypothetical protein
MVQTRKVVIVLAKLFTRDGVEFHMDLDKPAEVGIVQFRKRNFVFRSVVFSPVPHCHFEEARLIIVDEKEVYQVRK